MTEPEADGAGEGSARANAVSAWRSCVGLGAVMALAGLFDIGYVAVMTLASVVVVGAALIAGGAAYIIHAFIMARLGDLTFSLLAGVLYVAGGIALAQEPLVGSLIPTAVVASALVAGGIIRVLSVPGHWAREGRWRSLPIIRVLIVPGHWALSSWWLRLLGAIVSAALGIILYTSVPWSGLSVVGTLIGIELIIQGGAWLRIGMDLRAQGRSGTQ